MSHRAGLVPLYWWKRFGAVASVVQRQACFGRLAPDGLGGGGGGQLRIFPTADGRVVNLEGDVRVPGDFAPPHCIRSVTLLQTGPANAWLRLLDLVGVDRLTRAGFIEEFLLPGYAGMDPLDKLAALRWLRDNLGQAQSELEEEGESPDALREAVQTADLIRCQDGEYRSALAVYDPESDLIQDLFGDAVPYPDGAHYAKGWDRWAAFFRTLGLIHKPQAQDLLRHVDRLCQEASGGLSGRLATRILKLFDHVEEHWAELCREAVEDDSGEDLASALRERAWLPAETSARGLRRWPGAVAPEARLYRPDELHLQTQANLVSSQCPVFARARVKAEVQRALGFSTDVPLETVLKHFEHLLGLWGGAGRPAREPFEAALQDVYRHLGGYAKRSEAASIRARFAGVACLWYRGRLWCPEHAFHAKVPYFGDRRVTIQVKAAVRPAYQLLGLRERPSLPDFLAYVEELIDEFGEASLHPAEVDRLLDVYRRIGEEAGADGALEDRFPLLTEGGSLVDPQDVFYADAPWFQERITDPRVQYLHRSLSVTVTRLPWVRSLAREVRECPTGLAAPLESPEVKRRAQELESLIRTPEFRCGVARLVYHEHGTYRASIAGWLARTSIVAVTELTSELVLTLDDEDVVVGSGPSDQYLDSQGPCIYVAGNAGRLIRTFVAQAVNSGLDEHRLRDQSPLADILDCDPAEIDQTLTRLRIKPVDDEGAFAQPEPDEEDSAPAGSGDEEDWPAPDEHEDAAGQEEVSVPGGGNGAAGDVPGDGDAVDEDAPRRQPQPQATPAARKEVGPASRRGGSGTAGGGDGRPVGDRQPVGASTGVRRRPAQDNGPATEGKRAAPSPAADGPERGRPAGRPSGGESTEGGQRTHGGRGQEKQSRTSREVRMRRRKARRRREREKDRILTYVSFGPGGEAQAAPLSDDERRQRMALGDVAADIACAFERSHGRAPTKLAHNHPGWDIDSLDVRRVESEGAVGTTSRMIEVKGIRGPWTRQGVAISRRQFEASQQFGDRYWLYVVEFADDPARARVHPVHNPFAKINQFWFDSGWRQLADPVESPSAGCSLAVGQRIAVDKVGVGSVERVEERGALKVVHVRLDGGELIRKPFNPGTMRPL